MSRVVERAFGIHVVPLLVIDRHAHFRRVPVVQIVGAAVVLARPEVLRVVDVGIVVQTVPIAGTVGATPLATKTFQESPFIQAGALWSASIKKNLKDPLSMHATTLLAKREAHKHFLIYSLG